MGSIIPFITQPTSSFHCSCGFPTNHSKQHAILVFPYSAQKVGTIFFSPAKRTLDINRRITWTFALQFLVEPTKILRAMAINLKKSTKKKLWQMKLWLIQREYACKYLIYLCSWVVFDPQLQHEKSSQVG